MEPFNIGEYPDVLAEARAALKDSAKNVYVLPAGAFADFRLDAPPGFIPAEMDENLFETIERNGRRYAKMQRSWYELYVTKWNIDVVDLKFSDGWEIKFQRIFRKEIDHTAAAFSLCHSILNADRQETDLDIKSFPFIRKMMEIPYIRAFRPFCETFSHLLSLADELRIVNARFLSSKKNDAGIKACAVSLTAFLSNTISSL